MLIRTSSNGNHRSSTHDLSLAWLPQRKMVRPTWHPHWEILVQTMICRWLLVGSGMRKVKGCHLCHHQMKMMMLTSYLIDLKSLDKGRSCGFEASQGFRHRLVYHLSLLTIYIWWPLICEWLIYLTLCTHIKVSIQHYWKKLVWNNSISILFYNKTKRCFTFQTYINKLILKHMLTGSLKQR